MREAKDPRILAADAAGGDRSRTRFDVVNGPKPDSAERVDGEQRSTVMDAPPSLPDDVNVEDTWMDQPIPAFPADAEAGNGMEDTSLLDGHRAEDDAPMHDNAVDADPDQMVALVDVLQCFGDEAEVATSVCVSCFKEQGER